MVTQSRPRFTHYVIYRGNKIGIFNKWETVAKHTKCFQPYYKGYTSFADALKAARQHIGLNFYIESEEVPTFAEVAQNNPQQVIKAQQELIANLQDQLMKQGKNTQFINHQIENNVLKQKMVILEAKNIQLLQKLEKKETVVNRNFEAFKARILDTPWRQNLQPVIDNFPEFEQIVSQKICTEFPIKLHELQHDLLNIAFNERSYKAIKIVQRIPEEEWRKPGLLLLQIDLQNTDMPEDQIVQFYHNGMIDYLEFKYTTKTERLLQRFGEKFTIVVGNIATHSFPTHIVGCKIFASLPYADDYTYRPARKRIFISHKPWGQAHLKNASITHNINFSDSFSGVEMDIKTFYEKYQKTPEIPRLWEQYQLLAEGHYIQIWAYTNWKMLLPFIGEGEDLKEEHIHDTENPDSMDTDPGSPQSVDSTHRDF